MRSDIASCLIGTLVVTVVVVAEDARLSLVVCIGNEESEGVEVTQEEVGR